MLGGMPIDAVIFDCDGTLVDSEPLALETILLEARALGIDAAFEHELLALKGQSMANCLALVQQRLGRALPADFEVQLRRTMAETFRARLQPMPDALAMLEALHVPFCVASNGPRDKTELTLGLTGLRPHFDGRIFSAYEVGAWKPDPRLFLHAAQALGVAPERCAVVEDSEAGVRAGLAAGMPVYLLRSSHALPDELTQQVHLLDGLAELGAALRLPRP